jgi:hypothetical protein
VSKVGHHRVSLESTKLALGKAAHKYADHFETCRRKRNTIDCTFSNVATNTEAKEIVVQAKTVLRRSRRLDYEEPPRAENVRVETSLNRRRGLSPVVGAHTTPPTSSFERSRFAADAIACSKEAPSEIRDVHTNGSPACACVRVPSLAEWSVSSYDEVIGAWASWLGRWNLDIEVDPQAFFLSTTSRPKSIEIP